MSAETVKKIQQELRRYGDKIIAEHSQRYFKTGKGEYAEGDKFLGLRVPVLRKMVKKHRGIAIDDCVKLLSSEFHEERLFALLSLVELYKRSDEAVRERIFKLYLKNTRHINNWDLIDLSSPNIIGSYLHDRDRKILYDLAKSKSLWKRRIAVMATFYFIRENDFDDSLKIAELLLQDKEDLIHKAAGWMLREIWKRDQKATEKFLKAHMRIMPRTMLRYAIEKMPEDRRIKYLKMS
ncbi:MAG: DNA alkylation repair protein [Thermodesulfovibrionia bacterium]|nr:DNA alkylation repair protein [Thermodesulfovibrionia bacterium]